MIEAIRDQWLIVIAVVVAVALILGLWATRSKRSS
jgi:FtsZ-interacting cell division protein ZipA